MPLLSCEPFAGNGLLGVWAIADDAAELRRALRGSPADLAQLEQLLHPQKQLEFLASRHLVQQLVETLGIPYYGLTKDEFGKPTLTDHPGWQLSITHTPRHAAAVLHPTQAVGIDLEAISEKIKRVAPRILAPAELAHASDDPDRLAIYWTGKEALYKLFGRRGLFFREHLCIEPFDNAPTSVTGWIITPEGQQRCLIALRRVADQVLAVASEA